MDYLGTSGDDAIDQDHLGIAPGTPIYGLAGNDTIVVSSTNAIGGAGNDTITATGPFATAAYWGSPGPVTVDLQAGTAQDGYGTVDTLVDVHVVHGSANADTLLGSAAADSFYGGSGNDLIDGRGGSDTVEFFFSPSTKFAISYDEATGDVTVRNTDPSDGNFGTKTLRNIELIRFSGAGSDNVTIAASSLEPSGFSVIQGAAIDNADAGAGGHFAVTDLNGDGRLDLVVVHTPDSAFSTTATGHAPVQYIIHQSDGSYQLAPGAMSGGLLVTNFSAIAAADFNHDGKGDVAIAAGGQDPYANGAPVGPWPGEPSYVLMSGSGTNDSSVTIPGVPSLFAHNIAVGDINKDGFADVYIDSIWGWPSGASYFLINNGHGGFTVDRSSLPASISNPVAQVTQYSATGQPLVLNQNIFTSCTLFDANGDGAPDLAVLPGGGTDVGKVFLNDGAGHFGDSRKILLPAGPFGAGSLTWTSPTQLDATGSVYLSTVALDVNADGRQDLVSIVTGVHADQGTYQFYRDAAVQILINTGNGFVDESSQRTNFTHVTGLNFSHYDEMKAVDIDEDGFADIVLYRSEGNPDGAAATRILLNDGHGVFNEAPYPVGVPAGLFLAIDPDQGQYAVVHLENLGLASTGFAHYSESVSAVQFDWSSGRDFLTGALVAHPENLQSDLPGRWIHGTNGNNTITLSTGNEDAFGYAGNDTIFGGAGSDVIDGGAGIDTAVYAATRASSQVTGTSTGLTVHSAADGTDALTGTERLSFSDAKVAYDISGNAGTVAKILGAVFGPDSVHNEAYVGIGLSLADAGMGQEDLVQLALNARLGAGASHVDIVNLLYTNVVGSAPPPGDQAYYVGLLDSQQVSEGALGAMAADTSLNQANIGLAGLATTGLLFV